MFSRWFKFSSGISEVTEVLWKLLNVLMWGFPSALIASDNVAGAAAIEFGFVGFPIQSAGRSKSPAITVGKT